MERVSEKMTQGVRVTRDACLISRIQMALGARRMRSMSDFFGASGGRPVAARSAGDVTSALIGPPPS